MVTDLSCYCVLGALRGFAYSLDNGASSRFARGWELVDVIDNVPDERDRDSRHDLPSHAGSEYRFLTKFSVLSVGESDWCTSISTWNTLPRFQSLELSLTSRYEWQQSQSSTTKRGRSSPARYYLSFGAAYVVDAIKFLHKPSPPSVLNKNRASLSAVDGYVHCEARRSFARPRTFTHLSMSMSMVNIYSYMLEQQPGHSQSPSDSGQSFLGYEGGFVGVGSWLTRTNLGGRYRK